MSSVRPETKLLPSPFGEVSLVGLRDFEMRSVSGFADVFKGPASGGGF